MLKHAAAVAAVTLSSLSLAAGAVARTHHHRSGAVRHHQAAHDLGPSSVPTPAVAGPVSTPVASNRVQGFPYTASAIDLRSHGYTEKEYFVSGTARAYSPVGTLGTNGQWTVTPTSTAQYKTRILVRRPINMRRFSGNVVVEWMNASTGRDLDVGWTFGYHGMLHDGDIYVGVTTQGLPITSPTGLIAWDPQRYGSLSIPNDQYSYDIFSQVGKALLSPQYSDVLGGARPQDLIAYGDSQSAARLTTYVDAIQPRDRVYNAVLIHSRSGTPAALNATVTEPDGTIIRSDPAARVLTLETESDVLRPGGGGYIDAQQPDSSSFRLWELTGASHVSADEELLQRIQAFKEWPLNSPPLDYNVCAAPIDELDEGAVVDTALHDLGNWATNNGRGGAPPEFPTVGVTGSGASASYALNGLGDTTGGMRLPQITVPTETLHGARTNSGSGNGNCALEGVSDPFSTAQLQSLYPTHGDYVAKFTATVHGAERSGILEPYDAEAEIEQAQDSAIPDASNVP
jgi:hypothetical protein